jgi:hypothetical protein
MFYSFFWFFQNLTPAFAQPASKAACRFFEASVLLIFGVVTLFRVTESSKKQFLTCKHDKTISLMIKGSE